MKIIFIYRLNGLTITKDILSALKHEGYKLTQRRAVIQASIQPITI
jgi:archaellum component FlaD/FlaE